MGWSGSLKSDSAIGSSITFTPDTSAEGEYTVYPFIAPKNGVYRFVLSGSGGTAGTGGGGTGGSTTGYLKLKKDEAVIVGAGGTCSAAFVAKYNAATTITELVDVTKDNLYFVAGAGGGGAKINMYADYKSNGAGGKGGGTSGAAASNGGKGGTQTSGGANYGLYYEDDIPASMGTAGSYGKGGDAGWDTGTYGGRGGDGYYGGGGGYAKWGTNGTTGATSSYGYGGGGGAGYVKVSTLTVGSNTYTSTTAQGGGASSGNNGSIVVTYYAKAELPIIFNGVQLEKLIFNGVEIESLIHNGTKLFIERIKSYLIKQRASFSPNFEIIN